MKCKSANIAISGLGHATLWSTDELSGTISGGRSVQYYGSSSTNITTTGMGTFEALGNK